MTYNIFSSSAPAISNPDKGTKIIKFLSSETRKAIIPTPFSAFASHLQGVKVIIELTVFSSFMAQ